MESKPRAGDTYRQEFYRGHAEDLGRVLRIGVTVSTTYRRFRGALQTRDWSPLEPDVVEHKYYARGIGEVKSLLVQGGAERMGLVSVTRRK